MDAPIKAELRLLVERMRVLTRASASHVLLVEDGALVQRAVSGHADPHSVRSSVMVPALAEGTPVALLVVSSTECDAFGERDVATLELLAIVLSAALGQAAALSRFRTVFDGASVGIVQIDGDGRPYEANQVAGRCRR